MGGRGKGRESRREQEKGDKEGDRRREGEKEETQTWTSVTALQLHTEKEMLENRNIHLHRLGLTESHVIKYTLKNLQ